MLMHCHIIPLCCLHWCQTEMMTTQNTVKNLSFLSPKKKTGVAKHNSAKWPARKIILIVYLKGLHWVNGCIWRECAERGVLVCMKWCRWRFLKAESVITDINVEIPELCDSGGGLPWWTGFMKMPASDILKPFSLIAVSLSALILKKSKRRDRGEKLLEMKSEWIKRTARGKGGFQNRCGGRHRGDLTVEVMGWTKWQSRSEGEPSPAAV